MAESGSSAPAWVKLVLAFLLIMTCVLTVRMFSVSVSPPNSQTPVDAENKHPLRWSSIPDHIYDEAADWDWTGIRNVFLAFIVGTLGAGAFYVGVFTGFISRTARDKIILYLIDSDEPVVRRFWWRAMFFVMGGIVAAIFQWAQPSEFTPIQAFVLGATWPSVVTRIMSGDSGKPEPESVDKLLEAKPDTPDGNAEAVVNP